jgi:hypothetical protein
MGNEAAEVAARAQRLRSQLHAALPPRVVGTPVQDRANVMRLLAPTARNRRPGKSVRPATLPPRPAGLRTFLVKRLPRREPMSKASRTDPLDNRARKEAPMGFCTKCGSPRVGASRFCTKCGAEFRDQTPTDVPVAQQGLATPPPAEEPTPGDQSATGQPPTQIGLSPPSPELAHHAPTSPGPVLPPSPPPALQPSAVAAPSPLPSSTTPPEWPDVARTGPVPTEEMPRGPIPPYRPPRMAGRGNRRTIFVAAVVVVVLAAGGAAFALVSSSSGSGHPAARPSLRPTTGAASRAAATTAPATPTPTASPSPTASPGTVQVATGAAASPAAPQVTALLNRYFNAINMRNYAEFSSLLDAQMRADNSAASFAAGYATTKDSAETLTSISSTGGGDLATTVSFTSQQSPAKSIDHSPCNNWLLTLYLVPQGNGYVIAPAPSGYQPTYSDC